MMRIKESIVGLFLAAGALGATEARAEDSSGLALGFEVGPTFVVSDFDIGDSVGVGFAGRLGYLMDLGVVKLTPEVKLGFESPGTPDAFRILGGLRLNLFSGISPVAFAHLGGLVGDINGFGWDAGGGLDINLGPLALGAFVSYNRADNRNFTFDNLTGDGAGWEWIQIAASVTLVL
jgi:hypothetical protein